jgi:UDP-N-acetylglucosamine--N-acetylmuramyl-(pentapeptide) pyrophosphoryl-undecaprenol N-acetylglucosamine transferase
VLVAAGGTGGHLAPALAVAEELSARGVAVRFVTTPSQLTRLEGLYPAEALEMRGFDRRLLARQNAVTLGRLAAAAPRAWKAISRCEPDCVVGGGGYVSGPVVALAGLRRIPAVALEADAHLGVTNSLLRPYVKRIFLSFPIAGLEPPKYVLTGRPLQRRQVEAERERGLREFGLIPVLPVVLVFGGSQGARTINWACLDAFADRDLEFQVIHVCGERNENEVRTELEQRGAPVERYKLHAYTDRLADAMAAADLVVGRSGGSLAEIAALGRPAILVPYPYASADHQRKNASWAEQGGAAIVVDDSELTGAVLSQIVRGLLADSVRLSAMAAASRRLGRPQATQHVVDEIERLLGQVRARQAES